MTRKDYEVIAQILSDRVLVVLNNNPKSGVDVLSDLVDDLSNHFAFDNPRFDRDKFINACGFDPNQ